MITVKGIHKKFIKKIEKDSREFFAVDNISF